MSQDSPHIPERPRIHPRVVARRHVSPGRDVVILHDHDSHRLLCLEAVQWDVAALADGTRDETGIILAAGALGIGVPPGHLRALLSMLAMNEMLTEGPAAPWAMPPVAHEELLDEPLEVFPLALTCDGDGICCRTFASVMFLPLEVARARVTLPTFDAGWTPHEGVDMSGPRSPTLHEGRCAYLDDESGRCELHAEGGERAKPAGCRTFPNLYLFDGERVRVGCSLECGCVLRSLREPAPDGAPLVAEGATLRALPQPLAVRRLPEAIAVHRGATIDRRAARELFAALQSAPSPRDPARALWALADALEAGALDVAAYVDGAPAPPPAELDARLEHLADTLEGWGPPVEAFRGPDDLTRLGMGWVRSAARALLAADAMPAPVDAPVEAACVRAEAHSLRYAFDAPIASAMRRHALRLWLARALPAFAGGDRRASEPIALIEALFRGHGYDALLEPRALAEAPDAT